MVVNSEGQALTRSVVQSDIEHSSEGDSAAYNWSTDLVDAAAANATILLLKNTSDTPLHIESVRISSGTTASEYTIHLPTTEVTLTGGVVVTGTNLNTAGVANVADASAQSNETNNVQGSVIGTAFLAVDREAFFATDGLILGKNRSIGIDVVADADESAVTIRGHYEE